MSNSDNDFDEFNIELDDDLKKLLDGENNSDRSLKLRNGKLCQKKYIIFNSSKYGLKIYFLILIFLKLNSMKDLTIMPAPLGYIPAIYLYANIK